MAREDYYDEARDDYDRDAFLEELEALLDEAYPTGKGRSDEDFHVFVGNDISGGWYEVYLYVYGDKDDYIAEPRIEITMCLHDVVPVSEEGLTKVNQSVNGNVGHSEMGYGEDDDYIGEGNPFQTG
jgi:hypothetical protein